MKLKELKNDLVKGKYYFTQHDSGLKIFIYPKEGNNSTYVLMGTRYGSINTEFYMTEIENKVSIPAGTAHFLEHKMFENQEGDAFLQYAKTGASANAYTSFDKTCYLFSCTENFEQSLKILLNYIQTPYFTEETVNKEQGIIGQEIKMYEDDPDWRVLFNLLDSMYVNHPVKTDIAGTVETISTITPEKLYECYNAFYNPNNMAICAVGNIDPEEFLTLLEQNLKMTKRVFPKTIFPEEPYEVKNSRIEIKLPVTTPIFNLGFKEECSKGQTCSSKEHAATDILMEIVAAKYSPLYRKLLDEGLINVSSFGYEYFFGPGYSSIIFSGETKDPDLTAKIIKEEIQKLKDSGIKIQDFLRAKKAIYGRGIAMFNSTDGIANSIIDLNFSGNELFEYIECISNMNLEDVLARFKKQLNIDNCSLSVVSPNGE